MSRVTFFEGCPSASWLMQWHDDLTRALEDYERVITAAIIDQRPTQDVFLGI